MSLNPLFCGMDKFLNSNLDKIRIISTKASKYINSILSHYNVKINQRNIYSTENGKTKSEILFGIMKKEKVSGSDTLFVDDHLDTLIKMRISNVKYYLANWGYNTKIKSNLYNHYNIKSIDLDKFYQFFG